MAGASRIFLSLLFSFHLKQREVISVVRPLIFPGQGMRFGIAVSQAELVSFSLCSRLLPLKKFSLGICDLTIQ